MTAELTDYERGAIDALTNAATVLATEPATSDDKAVASWLRSQARGIAEQSRKLRCTCGAAWGEADGPCVCETPE